MKDKVRIMGILNVTPDSFYDGGLYTDVDAAVSRAEQMISEGVDIIDIGGESTRPGSDAVSAQKQIDRVCPVIERLRGRGVPISIDTTDSVVADSACRAGASIINDISGLTFDANIIDVAADNNAELVICHIKGIPGNMQNNPVYEDLFFEIETFLMQAAAKAEAGGVHTEKIIIDPGIGFGKTLEDNYRIINRISAFRKSGYRVLVGLSRKSLISKLYKGDVDRLPGTIALNTVSVMNGADIIRVHDVREHRLVLDTLEVLQRVS